MATSAINQALLKRAEVCLSNIALKNKRSNAFISLRSSDTVRNEVTNRLASQRGELRGRIIAVKDNFCTTDLPTTCASKVLKDYMSPYEATPVSLLRKAGGVIMGKTNMDEFAMGSNNDHSYFGPVLNPLYHDDEVSAGGSSGGSAAAVAADMCDIALGSDTGGSVRLPSSYCGIVGFKPSYGLVSRHGVIAYAQSLDTVGIMAKRVSLVKSTFDVLNQYDEKDPTSLSVGLREKINNQNKSAKSKLKIGVVEEAIIDISPEVRQAWLESLDYLRQLGHQISLVSIPSLKSALPTYFIVSPAEASSNLARYDGIRYGFRAESDSAGGVLFAPTRSDAFGPEVQRRILLGTYNLSAGAYGNHYEKAQRVRMKIRSEFDKVFAARNILERNEDSHYDGMDVLIHPTARSPAPRHEVVRKESAIESFVNDVYTIPANLAGIPAVSVPWKPENSDSSVGIQVIGQFGHDKMVLRVAELLEQAQS